MGYTKEGKIEAPEAPDLTAGASCFNFSHTSLGDIQQSCTISPAEQAKVIRDMGLASADHLLGGFPNPSTEAKAAGQPPPQGELVAQNLPVINTPPAKQDLPQPKPQSIFNPKSFFNGEDFQGEGFILNVPTGKNGKKGTTTFKFSGLNNT